MNTIRMSFNLLCLHLHLDNWTLHRPHNSFLRSRLSPDSMLPAFIVSTPHTTAQRAIARSASISPPRQQAVEANPCNARSASLGTSYVHRTPSICTCYLQCLQLHLETNMYWWVKLICQLPCMQQTAPPKSSWVQKMQCKRLPMCYNHTMIQPLTNESGNKRNYLSTRTSFHSVVTSFPSLHSPWIQPPPWRKSAQPQTPPPQTVRNKQSFTTLTNDDACAVYFLYLWNDFKVLNVTWQRLT